MGCPLLSLQTIPVSSEFSQWHWSQASTDRLTSLAHGARYMEQVPETSDDIHKNSCQPFSEKNPPRPCDPWVIHPCAFFMVAAYREAAPKLSKCDLNSPLLGVWPWIWLHQKRLWSEKANSVQPAGLSCPYFFFFFSPLCHPQTLLAVILYVLLKDWKSWKDLSQEIPGGSLLNTLLLQDDSLFAITTWDLLVSQL